MKLRWGLIVLTFLFLAACGRPRAEPPADRFVQGSYAYPFLENRLFVVDISRPDRPHRVAQLDLGTRIVRVRAAGEFAYALRHAEIASVPGQIVLPGGLVVIDVADPERPAVVGALTAPDYPHLLHQPAGALDWLLVADYSTLYTVDVRRPDLPTLRTTDPLLENAPGLETLLQPTDRLIGLGGGCSMRSPSCIGLAAQFDLHNGRPALASIERLDFPIYDAAVAGHILYTAGRGLAFAPLDDLSALAGSYRQAPYGYYQSLLAAADGYLFLATDHRLLVFDLADPLDPRPIAEVEVAPEGSYFLDLARQDDRLFLISSAGLLVIDISDPAAPRTSGFVDLTS